MIYHLSIYLRGGLSGQAQPFVVSCALELEGHTVAELWIWCQQTVLRDQMDHPVHHWNTNWNWWCRGCYPWQANGIRIPSCEASPPTGRKFPLPYIVEGSHYTDRWRHLAAIAPHTTILVASPRRHNNTALRFSAISTLGKHCPKLKTSVLHSLWFLIRHQDGIHTVFIPTRAISEPRNDGPRSFHLCIEEERDNTTRIDSGPCCSLCHCTEILLISLSRVVSMTSHNICPISHVGVYALYLQILFYELTTLCALISISNSSHLCDTCS